MERLRHVVHPDDAGLEGIYGTIFTSPPRSSEAHLRNVTVFADAEVDRSPCGTGTAAVMAVLNEMGLLMEDVPFVHESIVGTTFSGRVVGRRQVGDKAAIVPEIEGAAWITGEHTFLIDGDDPLKAGLPALGLGQPKPKGTQSPKPRALFQPRQLAHVHRRDELGQHLGVGEVVAFDRHEKALAHEHVELAALVGARRHRSKPGLPPTVTAFS